MEFTEIMQHEASPLSTHERRVHRSRSEQQHYLQLWQESHLSRSEFCQQYQINLKTFGNWLGKANLLTANTSPTINTPSPKKTKTKFEVTTSCIEFQFPNNVCLSITGLTDPVFISSIIQAIAICKFS